MLRRADEPSSVEFVIPNGVGTFTFSYRKAFTAGTNTRILAVFIDGVQTLVTSQFGASGADAAVFISSIAVNKSGSVSVKITYPTGTGNGNRQITIDNVSWTGISIKPEPTNFPTNFICGSPTTSSIPLSWTDAAGNTAPDGYVIQWSPTSYGAITAPSDGTPVPDGANAKNVGQGTQSFTATGLSANSTYFFKIWSYTNSGSNIDYKLVGEPQTSCTTQIAPCNFVEDFGNSNATSSYADGNFIGNNGIKWTYTAARDENGDANNSGISGNALMLRRSTDNSKIISETIDSGITNFNVKLYKGFTGNGNRQVELFINGVSKGISPAFDDNFEHSFSVNNINIAGNFIIEVKNIKGEQVIIDDIKWTCFTGTPEPNINIQGYSTTIHTGDITPSAADGTDFGGAILSGSDVERTFTLQNLGGANLILTDPAVLLSNSSNGFTVSAQPALNTMLPFANQTFKIKFNNSVSGTYTNTITIASNDPDTPNYSFQIKASVAQPLITTDKNSLSGFTYALLQGPSATQSFVVNGSSLGGDITVTASPEWEISTNLTYDGSNTSPWTTIVLPRSAAAAVTNKTIHVRLKDNLPVGSYTGNITLTSPGAVTKTVSLAGQVTAGIVEMKVTGNAVSVANGSTEPFALNNTLFASQNLGNAQTKNFEIKNLGGAPLSIGVITISGTDAGSFSILNGPAVGTVLTQNQTAGFQIRFAPTTIGTKNATVGIVNNDPLRNPYTFAVKGGAVYCSSPGEIIVAQQDFESIPVTPVLNYTLSNFGIIAPGPLTGFSSGTSGNSSMPKDNKLYASAERGYRIQGADPTGEKPSGVLFTFDNVDTSSYSNISLSFKIAGFSLGSVSNGMDDLDASNSATILHGDKLDYVLVEISPDGGVTWYQQAKVVSGALNLPWGFGSKNTVSGNRNYAADHSLTYFNSTDGARYSSISIEKLPAVANLKVRISAQDNALNESWILDDVQIKSTGLVPKVWDGTSWIPSPPTNSDKAIINADYNSETSGGFNVCQCEIVPGATLNIATNSEVKVSDFLINNGKIMVASEGNFVQVNETDTNSGTGMMRAEQKITLSAARQQYNFIISPVEGFNMKDLYKKSLDINSSPVTVPFVLYHNEATNTFLNSSGAYIKGRGLAVKEPALTFVPGEITSVFEGKPVNGVFTYHLINSEPANPKRGLNLIGNPYPSNMDLVKFYQNNTTSGNLSPTFYLWDSTANTQTQQGGDGYEGYAYAQFNAATPAGSGTPTKAQGDAGTSTWKLPTRYVSVAQGFLARAVNASGTSVTFSNSTRSGSAAQDFFGKTVAEKTESDIDRYWLNLINPQNIASNIAIVYADGGADGFTKDDSPSLGASDIIYSLVDEEKVSINGKSNFKPTDVITLGTNHFAAGTYLISLDRAEGIFGKGQPIFLKDKSLGTLSDLTKGPYVFAAEAGESTGRFEIVYERETVLGTGVREKDDLVVYRQANDFIIRSGSREITMIEMFDVSGRLIYTTQPRSRETVIRGEKLINSVYILKINRNGEIRTKKILR